MFFDRLRRPLGRGGPDGLVSLLGPLGRLELVGLGWQVLRPKGLGDVVPNLANGLGSDPGRVGAHVGYQAHRLLLAQFHPLVEALGQTHRLGRWIAQLTEGLLGQGRGDERRQGPGLEGPLAHLGHTEVGPAHRLGRLLGRLTVFQVSLPVADLGQLGQEGRRRVSGQVGGQRPVLLRDEGLDLPFPLNQQPQGHRLYPAG